MNQNELLYEDALELSNGNAPSEEYLHGLSGSLVEVDNEIQDLSARADYIIDADKGVRAVPGVQYIVEMTDNYDPTLCHRKLRNTSRGS